MMSMHTFEIYTISTNLYKGIYMQYNQNMSCDSFKFKDHSINSAVWQFQFQWRSFLNYSFS